MSKYVSKKAQKKRRAWFRVFAGLVDFFGTIGSFIVILACIILVTSLLTWLRQDVVQTFSTIQTTISDALVRPTEGAIGQ